MEDQQEQVLYVPVASRECESALINLQASHFILIPLFFGAMLLGKLIARTFLSKAAKPS